MMRDISWNGRFVFGIPHRPMVRAVIASRMPSSSIGSVKPAVDAPDIMLKNSRPIRPGDHQPAYNSSSAKRFSTQMRQR